RELTLHWKREVLAGFTGAIRSIPPGHSVLYLNPGHGGIFTLPHPYLVQYYIADVGGFAVSTMKGHQEALWVLPRTLPPSPSWGRTSHFAWAAHARSFDYFLVEGSPPAAFGGRLFGAPDGAVTQTYHAGAWTVWRRNFVDPPVPPPLSFFITW